MKDPADWKLIGGRQRRLEVIEKVLGKPIYGIDVRLPGMLYASVVQAPVFKGTLNDRRFDAFRGERHPQVVAHDSSP